MAFFFVASSEKNWAADAKTESCTDWSRAFDDTYRKPTSRRARPMLLAQRRRSLDELLPSRGVMSTTGKAENAR